ncbi:hypothetical protein D3C81_607050 [compost metagenome]
MKRKVQQRNRDGCATPSMHECQRDGRQGRQQYNMRTGGMGIRVDQLHAETQSQHQRDGHEGGDAQLLVPWGRGAAAGPQKGQRGQGDDRRKMTKYNSFGSFQQRIRGRIRPKQARKAQIDAGDRKRCRD